MKKYLFSLAFIAVSFVGFSQTIDTIPNYKGKLLFYRNYPLPNTATKYFNGFGNFVSLPDSTRSYQSYTGQNYLSYNSTTGVLTGSAVNLSGANVTGNLPVTNLNSGTSASATTFWAGSGAWTVPFALTTTGSSGAATFSSGTLNIPQYSGGASGWGLTGNASITPITNFLGTTDAQSLYVKTNGTIRALFDSVGKSFIDSIYIGRGAGVRVRSLAIGRESLNAITVGGNNIAIGDSILRTCTTCDGNVGIGALALRFNTTGGGNTAIGANALTVNTTGVYNTALGSTLIANTTGNHNFSAGFNALIANTTGIGNTAIGSQSLQANQTGNYNVALGFGTLKAGTAGYCVAVGNLVLQSMSSGVDNVGVGDQVMAGAVMTGSNNTAMGYAGLYTTTSGFDNVAIGNFPLGINTTGNNNIAIGNEPLKNNTTGNTNIAIGRYAGKFPLGGTAVNNPTGSIFIGDSTRSLGSSQIHQIVIGHNVTGLGSYTTVLGDSTTTTTGIYGDIQLMKLGQKFVIPTGTNGVAGNATLVGGTVTVSNTSVTASSLIMLTRKTSGGTIGTAITYTLSAGTSFTINSDNPLDTSTFTYLIIN